MKTTLLILSIALCGITNAQITLTQSDIPPVGTVAIDVNDDTVTTSPGSAGANQTWNLTTLKNKSQDTITFINPSSSPYTSIYPTANVATLYSGSNIYSYAYADASGAQSLGMAYPFISGPAIFKHTPPYRYMTFPATYGMSITDSTISTAEFAYPVPPADSMKVKSVMHYTELIDGWGNVTTPSGTYACLRDIAIRNHVDSTFIRNSGVWTLYNAPVTKIDTFYFWYSNNQDFLVAEMQIQQNLPKQGFYLLSSVTGVTEPILNSEITVYPNPSNGIFQIKSISSQINIIEITNVLGEKIYSAYINCDKAEIDLSNQTKGVYFYKIKNEKETIETGKLIIN